MYKWLQRGEDRWDSGTASIFLFAVWTVFPLSFLELIFQAEWDTVTWISISSLFRCNSYKQRKQKCLEKVTETETTQGICIPISTASTIFPFFILSNEASPERGMCGNADLLISFVSLLPVVLQGSMYLIQLLAFCKSESLKLEKTTKIIWFTHQTSVIVLLTPPRGGMKLNLVKVFRFVCRVHSFSNLEDLHLFLTSGISGMFSGHWISGATSRRRDLVVQLPRLIYESSFVLVAFVFVISFLPWYFMFSPADYLMSLSYSHCSLIVLFCGASNYHGKLFILITLHCSCLIFLSRVGGRYNASPTVKRLLYTFRH